MKRRFLLPLLVVTLFASQALAWNDVGHMTVAYLTWQQMSDAQKQKAGEILKHHPHYEQYLTANAPQGVDVNEWAFVRAATWPDWVRPSFPGSAPKSPAITKYHHPSWHYVDYYYVLPADKDKVKVPEEPATGASTQPTNAIQAIENAMAKLAADETSPEDRAVYLAWLIHLVGDIHQPLHGAAMVSTRFPKGDKGGNDEAVRVGTKVMNLHAFWDDVLGTNRTYRSIETISRRIAMAKRNQPEELPQLQKDRTPESWAKESSDLAINIVYMGGNLESAEYRSYRDKSVSADEVPPLPVGYEDNARALAQERVALASFRLVDLLKDLLK